MRVFTASLATETNTFSPIPTDLDSFLSAFYARPGEHPDTPTICSAVFPVLRRQQAEEGFTLIEGTAAWAEPGGYVRQDVYEGLRDEILGQLQAALPVDCVILGLHGAMVARETEDCEGELLACVRELVGPNVVVAAELDPHSHLTAKRVQAANLLVAFQEFPHIDFEARAEQVVKLALAATRGQIQPVISTYDCRMIDVFPTTQEPMRSFVDGMKALEGQGGILSVSLIVGMVTVTVPLLQDKGLSPVIAGQVFSAFGASTIFGRLLVGYLLDRFSPILISAMALFMPVIGCSLYLFAGADDITLLVLATLCVGFSAGAEFDIAAFLVARYFGLKDYARIFGLHLGLVTIVGGLSPAVFGYVYTRYGNYDPVLLYSLIAALIASLTLLSMKSATAYQHHYQPEPT